jgi:hypothetical protein
VYAAGRGWVGRCREQAPMASVEHAIHDQSDEDAARART